MNNGAHLRVINGGAAESGEPRIEEVCRDVAPLVFSRCKSIVGDEATAWDITQEVLVTTGKKLSQLNNSAALKSWVYRIATNRSLNELRRRKNDRVSLCETANDLVDDYAAEDPRCTFEQKSLLNEALSRLTERFGERKVTLLVRTHYDGMTQKEIGKELGISERAVRKALTKLQGELQGELSDLREEYLAA